MRDQIISVIQALHQNRELIADIYCQSRGVAPDEADQAAFTRLLKIKATTPYIEGNFRLDRRLRLFFDRAVNRARIYGNSTHYANVVGNLTAMAESYQAAVIAADVQQQDDCIDQIIELCDEFSAGMKEDIEHFRMVVDARSGYAGGSIKEKLLHNRNYVEQAQQMVEAVSLLDAADLLDVAEGFSDLTTVLRRDLYQRVEGDDDLRRRLFEVQRSLNEALFDLQAADRLVETLLRLDDQLTRQPDFEPPAWDDDQLPGPAFRFSGLSLPAYPDPNGDDAETLLPMLAEIPDDRRAQARPAISRAGKLDAPGELPPARPDPGVFRTTLHAFLAAAAMQQHSFSAVTWLTRWPERATQYPYPAAVWLSTLYAAIDNGLPPPPGQRFRLVIGNVGSRWETPVLNDICLEADGLEAGHPAAA